LEFLKNNCFSDNLKCINSFDINGNYFYEISTGILKSRSRYLSDLVRMCLQIASQAADWDIFRSRGKWPSLGHRGNNWTTQKIWIF